MDDSRLARAFGDVRLAERVPKLCKSSATDKDGDRRVVPKDGRRGVAARELAQDARMEEITRERARILVVGCTALVSDRLGQAWETY